MDKYTNTMPIFILQKSVNMWCQNYFTDCLHEK